MPWIRVEPDGPSSALDFHADACVVAYFSQAPVGGTTTVQIQEPAEAPEPEIHAVTGTHHRTEDLTVRLRHNRRYVGFQLEDEGR